MLEVIWSHPKPLIQVILGRETRDYGNLCWGHCGAVIGLGHLVLELDMYKYTQTCNTCSRTPPSLEHHAGQPSAYCTGLESSQTSRRAQIRSTNKFFLCLLLVAQHSTGTPRLRVLPGDRLSSNSQPAAGTQQPVCQAVTGSQQWGPAKKDLSDLQCTTKNQIFAVAPP